MIRKTLILGTAAGIFFLAQVATYGNVSQNYSLPIFDENYGSGLRSSDNYSLSSDAISRQPVGRALSNNYILNGGPIAHHYGATTTCGVFINDDLPLTSTESVNLSLLCGDPSGCAEVEISNNGVSWSDPFPYSTYRAWDLDGVDGERHVYARYKNGAGDWSGICSDSIVLDRGLPRTSISPASGTYFDRLDVTLTASETATIRYTTDGSTPTTKSPLYSNPINVASDTTVKGMATDTAGNVGDVASEDYTVCTGSGLSISGSVKDATLDEEMPLVTITLNTGQTTSTDLNGNYAFSGLPRGYYSITSVTAPAPDYVTYQKELLLCENSVSHDILLTKDAMTFGTDTGSGYSADSVNTSTGNFVYSRVDLELPGRGVPFSFERTYNSQDPNDGPLGFGWTHNLNISLFEDVGGNVTVRWGDGKTETWIPDGDGGYTPMYGVFRQLVRNPDDSYTVKQKDLVEYRFDTNDRLAELADENGNTLGFAYTGGLLTRVTDTVGREIEFSYDANGRITRILDPIGRSTTYAYDAFGNLATTTDLAGEPTTYTYNTNHQILTLTNPLGSVVVTLTYDGQRRVVASQKDALGGEMLYSYNVAAKKTQILDPDGNVSYHYFDDLLRLIQEEDAHGNSAYYVYNERGNIDNAKDKNGNVTTYAYDDNGNVLTKTDPLGNETSATYNENNNPLTKTDANGNVTTYTYDERDNLLTVTDAQGNTTSYTYDTYGQLLAKTDALGNVTTYEYDVHGNNVAVVDALGNRSTFFYDGVGRKIREEHPLDRAVAYEYDAMDRLVQVTDALGGTSKFVFDAVGNKTEHIDARGNRTLFAYDAKDRLIRKSDALGYAETYAYDKLDRRTSVTNPRGAVATIQYDALGNITHEIDALGNQVRYEYDANGNQKKVIDARGNSAVFVYDDLNRLLSTTDALGNARTKTYDANGNVLTVTDTLGRTVQNTYDSLNRLKTITDPLGNLTTNEYDALGRLTKITDALNRDTRFSYDALGRMTQSTDAAGGIVTATYDALGNRLTLKDTRGNSTSSTYDRLNRLVSTTDPLGNSISRQYDAVGNLVSLSNTKGTYQYAYDKINRLTSTVYPDLTSANYTYDPNGNRLTLVDTAGTTTYQYDRLDRLSAVTDPFGLTVGYTYDPNSNRTSTKYPGNKSVYYLYDALDRLSEVQDWGGVATHYEYDATGQLLRQTMGNGATVSYEYDTAGRLTKKEDRGPADVLIASYDYTLDAVGNRTGLSMNQPLLPRVDFEDAAFMHNAGNELTSSDNATFTYDGEGNRTSVSEGGVTTQYTYDYRNMLTSLTKGGDVDEYRYTSDGHRLASIDNSQETRFLLDLNGDMEYVLAELTADNAVIRYYVYADGLLYSVDPATSERHYYHYDPLGSTIATTDLAGGPKNKYAYLPFGETAYKPESVTKELGVEINA